MLQMAHPQRLIRALKSWLDGCTKSKFRGNIPSAWFRSG